jgi:hypothetical protein
MEHPPTGLSPLRSTIATFLVILAADISAGCAHGLGADEPSVRGAPALAADGRSADIAVVTIDAGATIPPSPGDSAGVFVQYAEGGHWDLSTTCDARTSGQSCAFDILISPAPGASFSGVEGQGLTQDDTLELRSDGTIRIVTATSFGTDGVTFDSDAGAIVEVDALLDGDEQPRLVNIVSDGAVANGVPTNPVDLSPSEP